MAVSLRDSCDDPPNCRCEGCAKLQRDVLSMRSLAGKPSQGQRRSYRWRRFIGKEASLPATSSMCHLLRARGNMYRDLSAVFTVPGSAETIQCPELDTGRGARHRQPRFPG